jgi:hypothetical protein
MKTMSGANVFEDLESSLIQISEDFGADGQELLGRFHSSYGRSLSRHHRPTGLPPTL